MIWTPFTLLAAGALAPLVVRTTRGAAAWILAAVPAALFVHFLGYLPLSPGASFREAVVWAPGFGVEISFLLDGLSAVFALLVTGIGALVLVYAGGYMAGDGKRGRLLTWLLLFLGAMLGLVLADNLITLFVFWELTSLCSYFLIGTYEERESSRAAALSALLVTGAGGLCLLAGFVLLSLIGGAAGLGPADSFTISALAEIPVADHPLYAAALVLVALGAFTKSAQFPFHFWLPRAMAAPTPVSALLHSATMVKAGIYLLARLSPILGGTNLWTALLVPVGVLTMVGGALHALAQTDLKKVLAFSTVSVLGMLVTLLGSGAEKAVEAAVVLVVAHAFYKATLFMVAGSVDHETGTREIPALGGLRRAMPWTFAAGIVAALSKAGAPPMFGFVGKELLYGFKLGVGTLPTLLIGAAVATNIALVATALLVGLRPFVGPRRETPKTPHEAPVSMLVGPLLLAGAGLFVGLLPATFDDLAGSAMASAILDRPVDMKLALWHGLNPDALAVMALSAATLLAGVWLYARARVVLGPVAAMGRRLASCGPDRWYGFLLSRLYTDTDRITRLLQNGSLARYSTVVVAAALLAVLPPLVRSLISAPPAPSFDVRAHEVVVAALAMAGAILTIRFGVRLAAVAAVGVTGTAVALLFLFFSAPDLSITQIMVETLSVILFVLLFARFPRTGPAQLPGARAGHALVAFAAGTMMALLTLAADTVQLPLDASRWFADASLPLARGRNVVNVILVDFRALDTLGEITVVAAAAFGVLAMLRLRPGKGGDA